MELAKFEKYGAEAFEMNAPMAPALDSRIQDAIKEHKVGMSLTVDIMSAWKKGYQKASDADFALRYPAPGSLAEAIADDKRLERMETESEKF